MRVLIACEYSGIVRDAFIARGHEAISCDLLPTDSPGPHYQGDLFKLLDYPWDLVIAHPPCTDLSVSGAKHFKTKKMNGQQYASVSFFLAIVRATQNVRMVAIENPICIISSLWRQPDQIIQPYMFGDEATKTTCLWLKNLPALKPTNVVGKGERVITKGGKSLPSWYNLPPSGDRAKIRSRTFGGIANAMADQWGINSIVRVQGA